jgi:chaperonin cofactor prefoldin
METPRLKVEFGLNDQQRTKALAKGMLKEDLEKLVLPVSPEVLKLLDESRVRVYPSGLLRILDHIEREHEDEPDKEVRIYLSEYGLYTNILSDLVDFIIEKGKTVFDEECLRKVYELQDRELGKVRAEVEKRREERRRMREFEERKEEARKLLRDEIERYEKRIKELESELRKLKDRISELESVIESYAEFIKEKELEKELVDYVMGMQKGEEERKIREKFRLEEDS